MGKPRITKKIVLLTLLGVALLGATGVFAYNRFAKNEEPEASEGEATNGSPTEEEKTAGDRQKEEIVAKEKQSQQNNPPSGSPKKKATVIITDAGQYDGIIEVRSFIPDHYQDGTCTITFRKSSQTVTRETPAYRDASTTICTNPLIKRSDFPSTGDWQVSVAYVSENAAGQSEAQTIKIK